MKVSTFQNHANKDSAELADLSKCLICPESVLQSVKVKSSQKKKKKQKSESQIFSKKEKKSESQNSNMGPN